MINELFNNNPYVVSDTHFLHNRITQLANRPANWLELITKDWQDKVLDTDNVFIGGDMFMSSKSKIRTFMDTYKLKGNIYLLIGNHDGYSNGFYSSLGITAIRNYIKQDKSEYNALIYKNIIISHIPFVPIPVGYYNLHGHVHNNPFEHKESTHINMCIELLNYKLVRFNDLVGGIIK
jgi:calcineurin-like phosphoesterase family protein